MAEVVNGPAGEGETPGGDAAELSRLLFECRESLEMWADVVEARWGRPDAYTRGLVGRVDGYRAGRGWSPHGFGAPAGPQAGNNHKDGA